MEDRERKRMQEEKKEGRGKKENKRRDKEGRIGEWRKEDVRVWQ